jgi:putative transposase
LVVKRQRVDFFHKESLKLVKAYDQVTFETLNIAGMMHNHHLAKSIADAAWNTFILIHIGKAANAGRSVVKVSAHFSSQDCSQCGNRVRKPLSEREHRCIECGFVAHRDHNSAIVLDKKGRAALVGMEQVTAPGEPRTYSV